MQPCTGMPSPLADGHLELCEVMNLFSCRRSFVACLLFRDAQIGFVDHDIASEQSDCIEIETCVDVDNDGIPIAEDCNDEDVLIVATRHL